MSYGDVCYNHGSALKCDLWLGLGLGRGVCTKIRHHNPHDVMPSQYNRVIGLSHVSPDGYSRHAAIPM